MANEDKGRVRQLRTSDPTKAFPSDMQPGQLAVNTANAQLAVGDANGANLGQPVKLIPIRYYRAEAQYVADDLVAYQGSIWRAKQTVAPGISTPVANAYWAKIDAIPNVLLDQCILRANNDSGSTEIDGSLVTIDDTGNILGVTASKFDSSTKMATTSFVNIKGIDFSNVFEISINTVLNDNHFGSLLVITAVSDITLPEVSTLPLGTAVAIKNTAPGSQIIANIADTLQSKGNSVASIQLLDQEFLILVSNSVSAWHVTGNEWQELISSVASTNDAIARFDGTTGLLQDSLIKIDDNGILTSPNNVIVSYAGNGKGVFAVNSVLGGIGLYPEGNKRYIKQVDQNATPGNTILDNDVSNGETRLFWQNSPKIIAKSSGMQVLTAEGGTQLNVSSEGSHAAVNLLHNVGGARLRIPFTGGGSASIEQVTAAGVLEKTWITLTKNAGVTLAHNNVNKFNTAADGAFVTGKMRSSQTWDQITELDEFTNKLYVDLATGAAFGWNYIAGSIPYGYRAWSGGICIQWGGGVTSSGWTPIMNFPLAFSERPIVMATALNWFGSAVTVDAFNTSASQLRLGGLMTTGALLPDGTAITYIAIGLLPA